MSYTNELELSVIAHYDLLSSEDRIITLASLVQSDISHISLWLSQKIQLSELSPPILNSLN